MTELERQQKLEGLKSTNQKFLEREQKITEDPTIQFKSMTGLELLNYECNLEPFITDTILDDMVDLYTNSIVTIIGSTGMGKSLLMLHLAVRMTKLHKVLYFSHENDTITDKRRLEKCILEYDKSNYNLNNFEYINVFESKLDPLTKLKWSNELLQAKLENNTYDVVFFDSIQLEYDNCQQDDIHRVGSELYYFFKEMTYKYKKPIFVSWQGSRDSNAKTIDNMTASDITGSYSMSTISTELLFIGRGKEKEAGRSVKVVKSRNTEGKKKDIQNLELSLRFSVEKVF